MPPSARTDTRAGLLVPADRADRGRPVAPSSGRWRPLGLGEVSIDGGFWADLQQLNATVMGLGFARSRHPVAGSVHASRGAS